MHKLLEFKEFVNNFLEDEANHQAIWYFTAPLSFLTHFYKEIFFFHVLAN